MSLRAFPLLCILAAVAACGGDDDGGGDATMGAALPTAQAVRLNVTSSAFGEGAAIPVEHSCDGEDAPLPVAWSGVPPGAASFVLVMDDPDAPGEAPFVHWLMYDIPANATGFESVSRDERLPNGAAQGLNSRGETGYAGPCPPEGQTHTYVLTVYALDVTLGIPPGAQRGQVDAAMAGHVVAEGRLTGTYGR